MIRLYECRDGRLHATAPALPADSGTVWCDLYDPTPGETGAVEALMGITLPSRDEMAEIELSSRLYSEDGGIFMTALVLSRTQDDDLLSAPVTFILAGGRLATIRYHDPRTIESFAERAQRTDLGCRDGESTLLNLLEAVVDRLADVLERAGHGIDAISAEVFGRRRTPTRRNAGWRGTLEQIGRQGDLTSRVQDSLATLDRLAAYLSPRLADGTAAPRGQLKALKADVRSLQDHSGFMTQKITFLLDATLGLISIEQNDIIKIFTVASVLFLPPTFVATVYGMNFRDMPELEWAFGYPYSIVLMVLSGIVPYAYARRRGWF